MITALLELGTYLAADTTLMNQINALRQGRNPDSPPRLDKPLVVYSLEDTVDRTGYHGASHEVVITFDVWHYGESIKSTIEVCQRISELMARVILANSGRVHQAIGWRPIESAAQDPRTIRYSGQFSFNNFDPNLNTQIVARNNA